MAILVSVEQIKKLSNEGAALLFYSLVLQQCNHFSDRFATSSQR